MRRRSRGYSFIEALVTLGIVGSAFMILMSVFSPSSQGVAFVQHRSTAESLAANQLEAIKGAAYSANPTVVPYPAVPSEDDYVIQVEVRHWDVCGGSFVQEVPEEDYGLQLITVQVTRPDQDPFELQGYKGAR